MFYYLKYHTYVNMQKNLFKIIDNVNLHYKVKLLMKKECDSYYYRDEMALLNKWTEGFNDRDKKMIRQFQETFHSVFWELALYQLLCTSGFKLDQTHQVPDFIVTDPQVFYVEAVVSNIGQNGTPECNRTENDQKKMLWPIESIAESNKIIDEAIIRASNAISSKSKKYDDYLKKSWVDSNSPYVIALSQCDQINYGHEYIYPMIALLYGLYYDPIQCTYCEKNLIYKNNNIESKIDLNIFSQEKYKNVSAIIYSCTNTIGKLSSLVCSKKASTQCCFEIFKDPNIKEQPYSYRMVSPNEPSSIEDGFFVFHNPNALNPLEKNIFNKLPQITYENNELIIKTNTPMLYTRFVANSVTSDALNHDIKEQIKIFNSRTGYAKYNSTLYNYDKVIDIFNSLNNNPGIPMTPEILRLVKKYLENLRV